MPRALFEKTGNAVYISHLDLMRLFQRAFKRAGLPLTHTQGFNPRPSVSIALPLSVGVESYCELLDFDLDGETVLCDDIRDRLNHALVEGVRVLDVYEDATKIKHLAYLDCRINLEYDAGIPDHAQAAITELFARPSLTVEKKSKNGNTEQDLIPMIRSLRLEEQDENTLCIFARVCCQNPSLNPSQLVAAINSYLPDLAPNFSKCCRLEIYDQQENIFR
jgi:radical SAM-linked protein